MASEIFRRRVENNITIKMWDNFLYKEMLKYCNRDTLAMIVIYQAVREIIKESKR